MTFKEMPLEIIVGKEEVLVTSIFSFSSNAFTYPKESSIFQFGPVLKLVNN